MILRVNGRNPDLLFTPFFKVRCSKFDVQDSCYIAIQLISSYPLLIHTNIHSDSFRRSSFFSPVLGARVRGALLQQYNRYTNKADEADSCGLFSRSQCGSEYCVVVIMFRINPRQGEQSISISAGGGQS